MLVPNLGIGVKLRPEPNEPPRDHQFELRLRSPNNDVLQKIDGGLSIRPEPAADIEMASASLAVNMQNVQFVNRGKYTLELWIDKRLDRTLPIFVVPVNPRAA
jgi:hypothetical protein